MPTEKENDKNLVGIAFSGGGIRSATFGLGVLEGLRDNDLLKQVHYISTVSGGGYVGAWFSANCKRTIQRQIDEFEKTKDPNSDEKPPESFPESWLDGNCLRKEWDDSVSYLRRYSNYLSPKLGFFSADTWSMLMVWLRNTLMVQLTVILAIAAILLVPRFAFEGFLAWPGVGENPRWLSVALFIFGVVGIAGNQFRLTKTNTQALRSWKSGLILFTLFGTLALAIGIPNHFRPFAPGPQKLILALPIAFFLVLSGYYLRPLLRVIINNWKKQADNPINYGQSTVQFAIVLPMLATGYLVGAILWDLSKSGELASFSTYSMFLLHGLKYWPFQLSIVFTSLWLLSFCSLKRRDDLPSLLAALGAPFAAVIILHACLSAIMLLLHGWASLGAEGEWYAYIWTPAMVLFSFSLAIVMLLGILGRQVSEGIREWWSRFGAWLGIYGLAWMVINVAAVYGPMWAAYLLSGLLWAGLGVGWIGTTIGGLLAGNSDETGKKTESSSTSIRELIASAAPFIFIAGLLILAATCLNLILLNISDLNWSNWIDLNTRHWALLKSSNVFSTFWMLIGLIFAVFILAMRVDINEFGLNAFYRSRLVRCFLGATRKPEDRKPQNFTQFDDDDDMELAELVADNQLAGPFHIVNCALNLGGSSDLSLHTRQSANFTLTPLRCGSRYIRTDENGAKPPEMEIGYMVTEMFGGKDGQPTLGQAISVSGAAASPNMGYHTNPVVAFLMTLFNVRLGWWFPNPADSALETPSPWFSLRYMVMELFGVADDKSSFVAISDGGHFENLAAYELINRRCKVIIISDGECDPSLQFEGLGTLIRVCKVDFNADIEIDVSSIRCIKGARWSANRCAVGTIRYNDKNGKFVDDGTLIYFKASMTGHEQTDVLQYQSTHTTFPHETTADQFYGEDQFESYRNLGRDIATTAIRSALPGKGDANLLDMAQQLQSVCAPSVHNIGRFTHHSARLSELWSVLGDNPDFEVLDEQFVDGWPKAPMEGFRSSFYLCSEMLQLMEDVFLDLNLENTWDHQDTKGWKSTFETWALAPAIKKTWELTADSYGLRFQYFCLRKLGLPLPEKSKSTSA